MFEITIIKLIVNNIILVIIIITIITLGLGDLVRFFPPGWTHWGSFCSQAWPTGSRRGAHKALKLCWSHWQCFEAILAQLEHWGFDTHHNHHT